MSDDFTITPRLLGEPVRGSARWSVYVVRIALDRHNQRPAIKVGMVGTGTIDMRCRAHERDFGPVDLLRVWSLAEEIEPLDDDRRWKVVEQYEARLQFAPELDNPEARLRRLRPDKRVYSFEWFEEDDRVLPSLDRVALLPLTLPHDWTVADPTLPTEGPGGGAVVPPLGV